MSDSADVEEEYVEGIFIIKQGVRNILRSHGVSELDIERVIEAGERARSRHEKIIANLDAGVIQGIDLITNVGVNMKQLNDEWLDILGQDIFNKFMNIPEE